MLCRCFGVDPEKSNGGSFRQRSSAQFTVVRLERLEDRFLLSGSSTADLVDPFSGPDLSSPAEMGSSSQVSCPGSPSIQQVDGSNGTTGGRAQSGSLDAPVKQLPASQQQPAGNSTQEKQQDGTASSSSGISSSTEQNGSQAVSFGTGSPLDWNNRRAKLALRLFARHWRCDALRSIVKFTRRRSVIPTSVDFTPIAGVTGRSRRRDLQTSPGSLPRAPVSVRCLMTLSPLIFRQSVRRRSPLRPTRGESTEDSPRPSRHNPLRARWALAL